MNEEFLLQVKGLHKTFGGVTAIANVSFDLRKGETLGIIGPNGSGKSTLLKLMSGILTPSVGSVRTDGRVTALIELVTKKIEFEFDSDRRVNAFRVIHHRFSTIFHERQNRP